MTTEIIVALIALCGSLCGSWLANRKTLSLMLYRLEQLEKKVDKHNCVIERTYKLEENERGNIVRLMKVKDMVLAQARRSHIKKAQGSCK